jgi:hypothetical protein
MIKYLLSVSVVLALFASAVQPTKAQTPINVSIGTEHFANGTPITTLAYITAVSGQPAPFGAFCGSDISSNCAATWTFSGYTVPAGDTLISATLTLGIYDIDSAAPGDQVASFTLNGTDPLTTQLNAASEGLDGGTGAPNSEYDVLTITIPGSDFAALASGTATFALTLQGPGLGKLGTTNDNGAGLDFSSLNMEAMSPMSPTPELSSWMLFLTGFLLVGIKLTLNKWLEAGGKAVSLKGV